jgi:hypothetical protein
VVKITSPEMLPLFLVLLALPAAGQDEVPVSDNSFLIEEAYNQEAGVVQHISVLELPRHTDEWSFGFAQEWPLGGVRHQLSYSLPYDRVTDRRGIRDVAINYRYQLLGDASARLAVAPRVSALLPTGDSRDELGNGALGLELNLPVSFVFSDPFVGHWNLGGSHVPSAEGTDGAEADLDRVFIGQGLIWLARPTLNFLLEALWERIESVAGHDAVATEENLFLSPGVRWAQNRPSGLQIVYGLALPVEVGPGNGDRSVFLYLSFEHSFRAARKAP